MSRHNPRITVTESPLHKGREISAGDFVQNPAGECVYLVIATNQGYKMANLRGGELYPVCADKSYRLLKPGAFEFSLET